jgi:hypothetical protein
VPNLQELRDIGRAVLDSIMPAGVLLGFRIACNRARQDHEGVRLVVAMMGTSRGPAPGTLGVHELPVEAAFAPDLEFVGTDTLTPVSRGTTAKADRPPIKVSPPLRVLVVASEPSGMPPVRAAAETTGIRQALDTLVRSGAVLLDFCEPPTKARLDQKLQEGFHVVHFIGHGDFEVAGADPTPQPRLYFEDGTPARQRDPADAEQLYIAFRNGRVPLVVLTACSSAAAAPNGTDYPPMAFESLAQTLVERQWGPSAAVAMQFDLETDAAEAFSRAFYEKLFQPGWSLDQALAAARTALIFRFGAGHRCWVTPALYWRCIDGRVFEFQAVSGDLTPEQAEKLRTIDALVETLSQHLVELAREPAEVQAAVAQLRQQWQARIEQLLQERGAVLGETLRLVGGRLGPDGRAECQLRLRTRVPMAVGDVRVAVAWEAAEFDLAEHAPGPHAPAGSVFVQPGPPLTVLVQNASGGAVLPPGEYELVKLRFRLRTAEPKPLFRITLADATVARGGVPGPFRTLDAVVFGA